MAITASIGVSRMLSFSSTATGATTANLFPKTLTAKNLASLSTPFIQSLRIKPLQHNRVRLSRNMSTSAATPVTASLAVGSKLPDATLSYFGAAGEIQTTTISDLTKSKKSVLFAVPGAFTPTCSKKHLPGFVEKSVNDVFVMKAWKENLGIGDEVMLLSDGNMEFTKAIGAELDLSDKPGKNRFTSDKKRVMLTATNKHTRGEYGRK